MPAPRDVLRELAAVRLGFATTALPDNRVDEALRTLGGAPVEQLAALPFDGPQWQAVIGALAIGETNFFRQPGWFAQLERQILAPAIAERSLAGPRRLRLWSAGCATGEEAYSLAILVARLLRDAPGWEISILGSDVSAAFIGEARRGAYREWSLRDVDEFTRRQHFRQTGPGRFELLPPVRNMVSFELLNLAGNESWSDPRLAGLDLIVCRNVLMYLAPAQQRSVAQRLIERLAPGGWLATAPAEATAEWFAPLTPVNVPSAVLFRAPSAGEVPRVEEPPVARECARSPRRGGAPSARRRAAAAPSAPFDRSSRPTTSRTSCTSARSRSPRRSHRHRKSPRGAGRLSRRQRALRDRRGRDRGSGRGHRRHAPARTSAVLPRLDRPSRHRLRTDRRPAAGRRAGGRSYLRPRMPFCFCPRTRRRHRRRIAGVVPAHRPGGDRERGHRPARRAPRAGGRVFGHRRSGCRCPYRAEALRARLLATFRIEAQEHLNTIAAELESVKKKRRRPVSRICCARCIRSRARPVRSATPLSRTPAIAAKRCLAA